MRTENSFKSAHEVIVILRKQTPWYNLNEFVGSIEKTYCNNCKVKEGSLKFGKVLNDYSLFMVSLNLVDDFEFQEFLNAILAFGNEYEIVQVVPFKIATD